MDERRLPGLGPQPEPAPTDSLPFATEPVGPSPAPSPSAGPRIAAAGCLFPLVMGIGIFGMLQALPHCGGASELAMERLQACPTAEQALGPNVRSALGVGCGQTEVSGAFGHSSWSLPVRGDDARGRYSYSAEKHGGSWTLTGAWLEVGDLTIDVVACSHATDQPASAPAVPGAPSAAPGKPPAQPVAPPPKPPRDG